MNNLIPVNFNNEIVITTKMLAEVYECEEKQIKQNFNNNKDKFEEKKHYYKLEGENLRSFKQYCKVENFDLVKSNVNCLYLWTKRGASRHCKMLGTDKAWDMFDSLEENYFNPKVPQLSKEDKAWLEIHHANQDANVTLIVNSTVEKATKQLNDAWGKVLIRELDGEGRTITLGTLADILNERMNNSCLTTNITNYLVHKGYLKKVRFIKEIEDRFGNIIYKEEKNCHNQPTENFINDFVKTGLAETKEIKPNGKILWNFTDRFITYFIDNFIEEFEKSLGQTSEEYLLEMEGDISE